MLTLYYNIWKERSYEHGCHLELCLENNLPDEMERKDRYTRDDVEYVNEAKTYGDVRRNWRILNVSFIPTIVNFEGNMHYAIQCSIVNDKLFIEPFVDANCVSELDEYYRDDYYNLVLVDVVTYNGWAWLGGP